MDNNNMPNIPEDNNTHPTQEQIPTNTPEYSYTPNATHTYVPTPPEKVNGSINTSSKTHFGLGTIVLCIVLSVLISTAASLTIAFGQLNDDDDNTSHKAPNSSASDTANSSSQEESSSSNTDATSTVITIDGNVGSLVEAVYDKSSPSVVGIRTTAFVQGIFGGTESSGEGSGVIYTADGYIITNYHVISDVVSASAKNTSLEVFFMDDPETAIEGKVIGYNVSTDLALIKVEKSGLLPIEIADSDSIKVGQYAIAIGCPGGLEFLNSVSYGIISGLNRSITVDSIGEMKLIQTDAAINPGNSGGALLNSKGQLIGINSSKLINESFEGMGFAIPSNTVIKVIAEIMEKKDNPSPYIGIEIYKYNSEYLNKYGLPNGAAVKSVVPGAPAHTAGIRAGDIITEFNKIAINEYTDFIDTLDKCKPGTNVTIRGYRNGRYYTATVTIGSNNSY